MRFQVHTLKKWIQTCCSADLKLNSRKQFLIAKKVNSNRNKIMSIISLVIDRGILKLKNSFNIKMLCYNQDTKLHIQKQNNLVWPQQHFLVWPQYSKQHFLYLYSKQHFLYLYIGNIYIDTRKNLQFPFLVSSSKNTPHTCFRQNRISLKVGSGRHLNN